ncbi:MAG TPA: matrixin family metalloprotease [Tepidisphaeraceae bacterium]|nr:matrixin family metalloprotease [Tepidisphaeraceae bacterium]
MGRGVDHIDRPVITEKLPAPTVNSAQPKTRYGVGNPFEVDESGGAHSGEYNTTGGKWTQTGGAGNPVPITFSFSNLLTSGLSGLSTSQIRAAVIEGLSLWSAVVPLRFTNVGDSGPAVSDADYAPGSTPNLRFGVHGFDGANGTLAHGYYPPPNGLDGLAGDIHFDNAETWSNDPDDGGYDLTETATHEIGHTLGLLHSGTASSVMWPNYQALFDGPDTGFLLADDINGIRAVYGNGFGYVVDSGTLYLSGTESGDLIYVKQVGSNFQVERDGLVATVATAGISRIEVRGRGGSDIIRLEGNAGQVTYLYGGEGDDYIDFSFDNRQLDFIGGYTYAYGGNGSDSIFVYDDNNTFTDTYEWDSVDLTRQFFGGAYYGVDIELMLLVAGSGVNTVNIPSTYSATALALNNAGGQDIVNIGNATNGVQSIASTVYIENNPSFTTLNINDSANLAARSAYIEFSGTQWEYLYGLSPGTIYFDRSDIASVNITTGSAVDSLVVDANSETLVLNSAGGEDFVQLGDSDFFFGDGMDRMTGDITVNNSPSFTHLILSDSYGTTGRNATWSLNGNYTVVSGLQAFGTISYNNSDIRSVDIYGSSLADIYNFNHVSETTTVNTAGGSDDLNINSTDAGGLITVNTGSGDDTLRINEDATGIATATLAATDEIMLLTILAGGRLEMLSGANITLFSGGVTLEGVLDIADNAFVRRNYAPGFAFYADALRNGYNGGLWNGAASAIVSTTAAGAGVAGDSVGYAFASQTTLSSLSGIGLNAGDLVVRYTLEGDANLDRTVNFTDLLRVSQNYGQSGRMWSQGNFDYDAANNVLFPDLLKLSQRYGTSLATANRPMRSNDDDTLWKQVVA